MYHTEKEKMLAGDSYNTRDPELIDMYHNARRLMKTYNNLDSKEAIKKEEVLTELLGSFGKEAWIEPPFLCDYGENIFIGEKTLINTNCMFIDNNVITIGENVLIAPYVQIYTAKHPLRAKDRIREAEGAPYFTSASPVTIGDNVWIGGNSIILPGVTIGENTTIGAGSVVTKDIPANTLAFGNPCQVVKNL